MVARRMVIGALEEVVEAEAPNNWLMGEPHC